METTESPQDTLATEDPQADEKNGAGEESAVALELMTDESEESEGAASLDVSRPRSLAEMLIEAGMLSAEQVRKAEEDARRDSLTLSRVLVRDGLVLSRDLSAFVALHLGLTLVDLPSEKLDPDVVSLLPEDVANRYIALPLSPNPPKDGLGDSP